MPLDLTRPLPRHAMARVRAALSDTRVVAIVGPRQSGKTTLVKKLAAEDGRPYLTLDDEQTRSFAMADPTGFVRALDRAVIDEIQRAPSLILAVKRSVDDDPKPGRFLITGSADLFGGSIAPDSLAGRVETIELLPLSQAEIDRAPPPRFLDQAFSGELSGQGASDAPKDVVARALGGGYPQALARSSEARRRDWLLAYVQALAERDVADIAHLDKGDQMGRLVELAALASGQLLNLAELGGQLSLDAKTIDRWLSLLEALFLLHRVRSWHRSGLKRLVKAPKLQFLDSGLLAALQGLDSASLGKDRQRLGPLLECFVYAELAKAAALGEARTLIHHYRDKDKVEVDFVLERSPGRVVGVEVKAGATVRAEDFRGLTRLREAAGDDFRLGVLLHDGDAVARFGDRLVAAPFAVLWR